MTKEWKLFIRVGSVICVVWVASFLLIYLCIDDWGVRGQFGDLFGAVNALFSGLAFAGLVITIIQQRHDLQLQSEAINQTNEELKQQTKEFDIQNVTLQRQQFDNTFFELLHMLQTIVDDLTLNVEYSRYVDTNHDKKPITCRGRYVFQELFTNRYYKVITGSSSYIQSLKTEIQENGVDKTFERNDLKFLYHYFRFVYRIIKYIDESTILTSYNERYSYVSFLRSTLSNYEIAILFYNCLTKNGKEKFKPLIERYAIFNNIDVNLLCNPDDIKLYDDFAYKKHEPLLKILMTDFQMQQVRNGLYQWVLNINTQALYGEVSICKMELRNADFFVGDIFSRANKLELTEYYRFLRDFKANIPHHIFKNKQAIWDKLKVSISNDKNIEENKERYMTFADILQNHLNSYLQQRNIDIMPKDNWTLYIRYNQNIEVEVPLKLIVVGCQL